MNDDLEAARAEARYWQAIADQETAKAVDLEMERKRQAVTAGALKAFVRDVVCELAFGGGEGGDVVQELAVKHGLLRKTTYDPVLHVTLNFEGEEGDPIYVFTDRMQGYDG